MKGCVEIKTVQVFGARLYIHWSAWLAMGVLLALSLSTPLYAIITICAYFGVILVHEAGHAFLARRLGYRAWDIYLAFLHGRCVYEAPYSRKHDAIIAWGGVAAQLVIAIPLIVLAQTTPLASLPGVGPIVVFLGYFSALIALFNLAPSRSFDGGKAWALIPILLAERRRHVAKASTSSTRDVASAQRKQKVTGTVTRGPWKSRDD